MVDRTRRELTDEEIKKIADTYHAWRGEKDAGEYADLPASASPQRWATSASTTTCSRRGATWARQSRKTTASRSRKRWRGWRRCGVSSGRKRPDWMRRSRPIWRPWAFLRRGEVRPGPPPPPHPTVN